MKNLKKILALVLVLAMALSVVACASAPADSTTTPDSVVDNTVEENTPNEEVKEEEPYTITISVQAGTGVQEYWDAVKAGYEALNPNATINVDLKASEGYSEWAKTIGADYKNNTVDLVAINLVPDLPAGATINWNEYMEEVNPYDAEGKAWKDCFNYNAQTRDGVTGDFSALSLDSVQVTWFYNKDLFAKAGVEAPKTWDEFVKVCEALDAIGVQPLCVEGSYDSFYAMRMGWLAQMYADQTTRCDIELYRAQPGDYCYNPDTDGKFVLDLTDPWNDDAINVTVNPVRFWSLVYDGTLSANTPGTAAVWTNFAKIFPKYAGGDAFFGTTDGLPLFWQGKAAITCHVSGFAVSFAETMKKAKAGETTIGEGEDAIEGVQVFDLGMFNMPSMTNESGKFGADEIFKAPARTIEVSTGFLGAFSRSAEQDAHIVDFMMYYCSAEGHSLAVQAGLNAGWTPAGASLVYGVTYPEDIQSAFEATEWIGNCQKQRCAAFARGLSDNQESTRKFYDLAQQCLTGKITPEQYAEQMAEQHMSYFNECLPSSIAISDFADPSVEPVGQEVEEG